MSYREYLDFLSGPNTTQKKVVRSLVLATFIGMFTITGLLSAAFFYYTKTIQPQIAAADFIQTTSVGFISTKQSLNDVLSTFQVAGEKVSVIDNLQNNQNAQEGFFVDLADKQKLLEKIRLTKQNVQFQKSMLQKEAVPPVFQNLTRDLINYYSQSEELLGQTEKNHQFFKDMLLALGSDFYLPILSDDSVWKSKDPQKVLAYYEDKKAKAQNALTNIARLSPQPDFKDYYNDEVAYLELFVNLSSDITSTLKLKQEQKPDEAEPLEQAYQKLINAKTKNSEIAANLLAEKEKLLVLNENLDRFASVRFQANSLESRIKDESVKFEGAKGPIQPLMKYFRSTFMTS